MTTKWTIPPGKTTQKKRKGRGSGSGLGKTSGRGNKGQLARSGQKPRMGFEGGQTPIYRRIPKFGFKNVFKKDVQVINLQKLNRLPKEVQVVDPEVLWRHKMISDVLVPVKVLGHGVLDRKLEIRAHQFSSSAREKIQTSGGKFEIITR
jgi:large subunit ribosomal protein L15